MVWGTGALIGARQIDAVCRISTRSDFHAFVDVHTVIVGCDTEPSGTDAKAVLPTDVNAFLVVSIAGIRRGAIVACPEAVVEFSLKVRRTAAITVQAKQVSRALEFVRTTDQLEAVNLRIATVTCRTFARCPMANRSTARVVATGVRYEAGVETFQDGNIASFVIWTVVICGAFSLWRLAAGQVRLSTCPGWANTLKRPDAVVTLSTAGARERHLVAFVDISADSVRHEDEASWTDAESCVCWAVIDTLLIIGAGVRCCAVVRSEDTEEAPLLEGPWAAAVLSETLQITRALMVVHAASGNGAFNVGISA